MSEYVHGEPDTSTPEALQAYIEKELSRIEDAISRNLWEYSFSVVNASQTLGKTPYVFADASGGAITLTLPERSSDPYLLQVMKTDSSANAVTIAATSINGDSELLLIEQYDAVKLYWDNTEWFGMGTNIYNNPVFKTPASVTVVDGGTPVGTVSDMQVLLDGNEYNLPEASGTPGFDLEVNFTTVLSVKGIVVRAYYEGSSSHHVDMKIRNYDTAADDTIINFQDAEDYNYRTILIPDDTDYIDGSGNSQITFYHPDNGTPAHDMYIDYIAILS